MGQILINEEVKENIKKECYLYGKEKDDVYICHYKESGEITNNGSKYPLLKKYSLHKSMNDEYERIEELDEDVLAKTGTIQYNVVEFFFDPVGLAIYRSDFSNRWFYYYRDTEEYCFEDSIQDFDYQDGKIYNYHLDGNKFVSYNGIVYYDIESNKLFLNYGGLFELDPECIYESIVHNTIGMSDESNKKLLSNSADLETVCAIMDYYKIHSKFVKDLPEINDRISMLNSLSLENTKKENNNQKGRTPAKRNLVRKPEDKKVQK